jgi:hypothetical protein
MGCGSQHEAARLLFTLAGRCPEALSVAAIACMAEHVLDGRTREGSDDELSEVKQAMIVFYLTNTLAVCMGCPSPQAHTRAIMALSNQGREGQQFSLDRAINLGIRALQYYGARPCSSACLPLCLPSSACLSWHHQPGHRASAVLLCVAPHCTCLVCLSLNELAVAAWPAFLCESFPVALPITEWPALCPIVCDHVCLLRHVTGPAGCDQHRSL